MFRGKSGIRRIEFCGETRQRHKGKFPPTVLDLLGPAYVVFKLKSVDYYDY